MKPDWSSAPSWANFLTMDEDGTYVWWAEEPEPKGNNWVGGKYFIADPKWVSWTESLERRP